MNVNENQSSDGIELLFDRWIVRTGWGEINCDVGQVRYNNPVLIDKEESSSPRLTDHFILVVYLSNKICNIQGIFSKSETFC